MLQDTAAVQAIEFKVLQNHLPEMLMNQFICMDILINNWHIYKYIRVYRYA